MSARTVPPSAPGDSRTLAPGATPATRVCTAGTLVADRHVPIVNAPLETRPVFLIVTTPALCVAVRLGLSWAAASAAPVGLWSGGSVAADAVALSASAEATAATAVRRAVTVRRNMGSPRVGY